MFRNKLILAALSSVLIAGAAAGSSLAAPHDKKHHSPRPHSMMGAAHRAAMREVIFVRMLQHFDTNKDGQISKQEAKDSMEAIFVAIDSDKDGSLTPGEVRKYREAQMAKAKASADDMADDDGAPMAPPADADSAQPAAPSGPNGSHDRGMERGLMHGMMMIQLIDTDENGQISKSEAESALDKFFTWMDRNKDGTISLADMPDRPFP